MSELRAGICVSPDFVGAVEEGNICLNRISDRRLGHKPPVGQPRAGAGETRSAPGKVLAGGKRICLWFMV